MLATLQSAPWVPLVLIVAVVCTAVVVGLKIGLSYDERKNDQEHRHSLEKIEKNNALVRIEHDGVVRGGEAGSRGRGQEG